MTKPDLARLGRLCAYCGHRYSEHAVVGSRLCGHTELTPDGDVLCECPRYVDAAEGRAEGRPEPAPERNSFAICELCDDGDPFTVRWGDAITEETFTAMRHHLQWAHARLNLRVTVRDEAVSFTIGDD